MCRSRYWHWTGIGPGPVTDRMQYTKSVVGTGSELDRWSASDYIVLDWSGLVFLGPCILYWPCVWSCSFSLRSSSRGNQCSCCPVRLHTLGKNLCLMSCGTKLFPSVTAVHTVCPNMSRLHPLCLFSEDASRLSSSGVPSHDFYRNFFSAWRHFRTLKSFF